MTEVTEARRVRRLVVAGADGISVETAPLPPLRAGELAIRVACSLISPGTELHYLAEARRTGVPRPLGYCAAGTVVAIAPGVPTFSPGDRVIAMGFSHALHADRVHVPYRLCVKLPDDLPFERAVFANLAATALHAVHRASLRGGEAVLVAGAGLVGQLVAQCARGRAGAVFVSDPLPFRAAAALAGGATAAFDPRPGSLAEQARAATLGAGLSAVFLCVRGEATELLQDSIAALTVPPDGQRRGAIIAVGRFTARVDFSVELGNVDLRYAARCGAGYRDDDHLRGLVDRVPPGEISVTDNLEACVRLLAAGALRTEPLHTHRLAFDDAARAYALFDTPGEVLGVTLHHEA